MGGQYTATERPFTGLSWPDLVQGQVLQTDE